MLRKPEDFYKEGSKVFRKAPFNVSSIKGWITISEGKVADSLRAENSNTTRLGAAYDAILNLSFALLCSKGWRCTSADGHHVQALEAACAYAELSASVFDQLDAIRDLRNDQYQGVPATSQDVDEALALMARVIPALLSLLPART
ncbi:hypothetical protein ACQ859_25080 [Roseateles chitinivorans]|uniref:hypothetical protein n=1 Tax=Roseateles chitinivorans TaxID=2917965 RepID=UPI003D677411